jgi:hypothetical protein
MDSLDLKNDAAKFFVSLDAEKETILLAEYAK